MADSLKVWFGKLLIKWGKRLAPNLPASAPVPVPNMFGATARQDLEEMLGYERFVLNKCGDAIRTEQGTSGPTKLTINDDGTKHVELSLHDTIGDIGANMVRQMSPLVFTAGYKLLDMVVEWTIAQNGITCPFKFEDKIDILKKNTTLQYPDFLNTDLQLRNTAIALYREMTPYRNAITHNRWGTATVGALDFDFTRKKHYKKTVPFPVVLALADGMELLGEMLLNQSASPEKLDTLRYLFDQLATFHGQALFNIKQPGYVHVVRRTKMPQAGILSVDLQQIRATLSQMQAGRTILFDLTVEADGEPNTSIWRIPYGRIPNTPQVILDSQWDSYKVP